MGKPSERHARSAITHMRQKWPCVSRVTVVQKWEESAFQKACWWPGLSERSGLHHNSAVQLQSLPVVYQSNPYYTERARAVNKDKRCV